MDLNQLIDIQKEFDSKHIGKFYWAQKVDEQNIEVLGYLLLCLAGEFGETTNLVKKVMRGDYSLNDIRPQLGEEIADMFIYVLKLAYQLDIDIEKQFLAKVDKNKSRFVNYEKTEDDV
jgi:NTP pyrophosphatase (non-canonical NTP hydrolase)